MIMNEYEYDDDYSFMEVTFLGTDLSGRSVLICRYIHPLSPPPEVTRLDDYYAIEKAAAYVALIPFLEDRQVVGGKRGDGLFDG